MKPQLNGKLSSHLVLVLLLPVVAAAQGTFIVGTENTKDYHPFGINSTNLYTGEYQQIFASTAFPNAMVISGLAFTSSTPYPETADYQLSVSLGTTARTPGAPGTTFISSLTPVFSGDSRQVFTAAHDFDLVLSFPIAFNYDPTDGNLVLDVVMTSASAGDSGLVVFDAQSGSLQMGTLWTEANSVLGTANYGMVTEFVVPEPSTFALFGLAGLLLSTRLFRNARV